MTSPARERAAALSPLAVCVSVTQLSLLKPAKQMLHGADCICRFLAPGNCRVVHLLFLQYSHCRLHTSYIALFTRYPLTSGPSGIIGEFPSGIPANFWEYGFRKIPARIPGIFSQSLNLDYLHTNFTVKNLNYALNAKQRYFVT